MARVESPLGSWRFLSAISARRTPKRSRSSVMLILLFSAVGVGMVLVVYGTIVKNQFGINLDGVSCPNCNKDLSQIRLPKSLRQVLWGGYTCPACGTEIDKWGRRIEK